MTPKLASSIGDLVAIVVALWFVLGTSFADIPAKRALDAVAAFVILLSAWRIWRRHRA